MSHVSVVIYLGQKENCQRICELINTVECESEMSGYSFVGALCGRFVAFGQFGSIGNSVYSGGGRGDSAKSLSLTGQYFTCYCGFMSIFSKISSVKEIICAFSANFFLLMYGYCMALIIAMVSCARSQDSLLSVSFRRVHAVCYIATLDLRTKEVRVIRHVKRNF